MTLGSLKVRQCFRIERLGHLATAVADLEVAFARAKRHVDSGREAYHKEQENLPDPAPLSVGSGPFYCGLTIAAAEDMDLADLLDEWHQDLFRRTGTADLVSWIDKARELSRKTRRELINLLQSGNEEMDVRVLASVLLLSEGDCSPSELLYTHVILTQRVSEGLWKKETQGALACIIKRGWQRVLAAPFLLRTPRLVVPSLSDACADGSNDLRVVARILLAASEGVSLRLGQGVRTFLRDIARASRAAEGESPVLEDGAPKGRA
jgi:hypothetical protein